MRLLWACSYTDFDAWAANEPHALVILRRAIGVASSWAFLRFQQTYMCYPWLLVGVVDPRRDDSEKRATANAYMAAPEDMADSCFGLELRMHISSPEEVLQGRWNEALLLWSWERLCRVAQSEFQHGRNRRRAHENTTWQNFVSKTYNQEAVLRLRRQHQAMASLLGSPEQAADACARAVAPRPERLKRKAAFDIFKKEHIVHEVLGLQGGGHIVCVLVRLPARVVGRGSAGS